MRFVLLFILFIIFGYSIALVLSNTTEIEVNLLFTQVPAMNTAVLLLISLLLGVVIGVLLALLIFKVIQIKWENGRLKKEVKQLRQEQVELATKAATAANSNSIQTNAEPNHTDTKDTDVLS